MKMVGMWNVGIKLAFPTSGCHLVTNINNCFLGLSSVIGSEMAAAVAKIEIHVELTYYCIMMTAKTFF